MQSKKAGGKGKFTKHSIKELESAVVLLGEYEYERFLTHLNSIGKKKKSIYEWLEWQETMSFYEIARKMGVSPSAARSWFKSGMAKIEKIVKKHPLKEYGNI